ncbi:hypothetical protein Bca101_066684 [Brassica carinata]
MWSSNPTQKSWSILLLIRTGNSHVLHAYIQDIMHLLSTRRDFKVVYKCREGNRVEDRVAKKAYSLDTNASKLYSVMPNWVKPLVDEDKIKL